MRYVVVIDDGERRGNGDESTFQENWDEVSELLRSGYYEVVYFSEDATYEGEE